MSPDQTVDRALAVLLAFMVCLVVAAGCDSGAWPAEAEKAQESTATVETATGWGSAVAFRVPGLDRDFFLTAKHVIEGRQDIHIRVESHERGFKAGYFTVPAKVVMVSKGCDAAILTIPPVQWKFRPARIQRELPRVGQEVIAVGNMAGANFDRTVSQGIVAQLGVLPQDIPNFPWPIVDQTTAINLPGSSGGGLFNRETGRLVGIQVGNAQGAVFLYLPSRVLLAYAHAEGWGWLFGDGRVTEKQIGEMMESAVPPLSLPKTPSLTPVVKIPPAAPGRSNTGLPGGLDPALKKGHR